MYLNDVCTIPTNLAGAPGHVGAVRHRRRRPARRRAGAGPGARRGHHVPGRRRARSGAPDEQSRNQHGQRSGADEHPTSSGVDLDDRGSSSSASRSTPSWPPPPRCSPRRPTSSATSPTPTSTRSRSACPARCRCSTSRPSSSAIRVGLALNCVIAPLGSSPGRTTSTRTCRRTTRSASTTSRSTSTAGSSCPTATVVGIERAHLEEDTGKSTHMGGGGRIHGADVLARRLQPRRRAAARDRRQARPAHRPSRPGPTSPSCALDPRRHRRLRREDGGGLDAGRRQRVGPPGRRRRARHPLRDQERQLAARRSGGPSSTRPAARSTCSRPASGSAGDPPLGRGRRAAPDPLRSKEEADDYRYFPEPDLVALDPSAEWIAQIRAALPLLPAARRHRLAEAAGAELRRRRGAHRRARPRRAGPGGHRRRRRPGPGAHPRRAQPGRRRRRRSSIRRRSPSSCRWRSTAALTATQAKTVLADMVESGGSRATSPPAHGFEAMDTSELDALVDGLIAEHPDEWAALLPTATARSRSTASSWARS